MLISLRFCFVSSTPRVSVKMASSTGKSFSPIVQTDISVPKLRDSKDVPALCVQLFRLGDFFLLDDLKDRVTSELKAHIDNTLMFVDTKIGNYQCPVWLTEVLDALEEGYKDDSTRPILEILLSFVCLEKHKIFQFKDAVALLDKIPEMAKDVMKSYIAGDMSAQPRTSRFRIGLPVLEAVSTLNDHYDGSTAKLGPVDSPKLPCQLYPVLESTASVFKAVDPNTESKIDNLSWMTPTQQRIKTMTSHPDSEIVRVATDYFGLLNPVLYIRFDDCSDARAYVERYCRANRKIETKTLNSGVLSENMRLRVAGAAGME